MSINTTVISGRLGRDPEVQKTRDGKSVCNFSLACDKDGAEGTDWVPCVVWGKGADIMGQYARKGDEIGVEGSITTRPVERDGIRYTEVKVLARRVHLPPKKSRVQNEPKDTSYDDFVRAYKEVEDRDDIPWDY